jgi:Skp family chaperone for outer membrane proteins
LNHLTASFLFSARAIFHYDTNYVNQVFFVKVSGAWPRSTMWSRRLFLLLKYAKIKETKTCKRTLVFYYLLLSKLNVVKENPLMLNVLFRRLSSIVLAFVLLASASSQAFADVVGYVNYDQIRNGYEKAQRLIGEIKVKDAGLRKNQADYVKQIEDSRAINAKNPIATKNLEQQLESKLQSEIKTFQEWSNVNLKAVDDTVTTTIKKVAQQKGVTVVIDQQSIVTGGLDLTPEIIRVLNAMP